MTSVITEQGDLGLGVYDYDTEVLGESKKENEEEKKDKK